MKKRMLLASLSMALVLGVAGIVTAASSDNNSLDMQPETSKAQTYMNNNDFKNAEVEQEETTVPDQAVPSEQEETSVPDQTAPSNTNVYDQMKSYNASMNEQMENVENMPINTQTKNMPTYTQMNDHMTDSQYTQGMAGMNNNGNNMMGSMGGMGR